MVMSSFVFPSDSASAKLESCACFEYKLLLSTRSFTLCGFYVFIPKALNTRGFCNESAICLQISSFIIFLYYLSWINKRVYDEEELLLWIVDKQTNLKTSIEWEMKSEERKWLAPKPFDFFLFFFFLLKLMFWVFCLEKVCFLRLPNRVPSLRWLCV